MGDLKDKIIAELKNTKRMGIDELIEAMEDGGFFEAPCSGQHHLAEPEGLMKHSWNVLEYARKLNEAWGRLIPDDSLVLVCLLHDLGKMGDHGKSNYVENILKDGKQSKSKPYVTNPDLVYIDHEIRSVTIAERYIFLSEEEEQAIYFHNGLYGIFKYAIQGKETPLYMILHFSDMWCSRVIEIEEEGKEEKE